MEQHFEQSRTGRLKNLVPTSVTAGVLVERDADWLSVKPLTSVGTTAWKRDRRAEDVRPTRPPPALAMRLISQLFKDGCIQFHPQETPRRCGYGVAKSSFPPC